MARGPCDHACSQRQSSPRRASGGQRRSNSGSCGRLRAVVPASLRSSWRTCSTRRGEQPNCSAISLAEREDWVKPASSTAARRSAAFRSACRAFLEGNSTSPPPWRSASQAAAGCPISRHSIEPATRFRCGTNRRCPPQFAKTESATAWPRLASSSSRSTYSRIVLLLWLSGDRIDDTVSQSIEVSCREDA